MKIEIDIDENIIAQLVTQEIARRIVLEHGYESREAKIGIRDGLDKATKEHIYNNKDTIIERCIEKATKEIIRKGLPKLIEKFER